MLVEGVVDGPLGAVAAAFGGPFAAGRVAIGRDGPKVTAAIEQEGSTLAVGSLSAMHAIEPTMLRWNMWLGYANKDGSVAIVEYGPRLEPATAFLSETATLETGAGLARTRQFRDLNIVSACYVEGALELTAPATPAPMPGA